MWYSTSNSAAASASSQSAHQHRASLAAGGATPSRKTPSASSGYRLSAAAAVSGGSRYTSVAAHERQMSAAVDEPRSYNSSGANYSTPTRGTHYYSRDTPSHSSTPRKAATPSFNTNSSAYARDDQNEQSTTVYRAPRFSNHAVAAAPATPREFDPKPGSARFGGHSPATSRSSATISRQRASPIIAYSTSTPPRSTTSDERAHNSPTLPSNGESGGMSAFCTQVPQSGSAPTPGTKSSPPRHRAVAKRNADGSTVPATSYTTPTASDSYPESNKKVPRYDEYNNVRHPPHYYREATPLLPYLYPAHRNRHLLVLDLDETLVHASAQMPSSYDASFNVDMETQIIKIYVKHRPFMMEFLRAASRMFEVCVFTASLSKYANQVLDNIDPKKELITHRLYREHCTEVDGSFTKDMAILGRPLENVVIVDNSPIAYMFFPGNAMPCTSWFDDETDNELRTFIPKLEVIAHAPTALQGLRRTQRRNLL